MKQLFYSTEIYKDTIILSEDEARHCLQVLRKRSGDRVEVVDGKGGWFEARIVKEDLNDCLLKIETCQENVGETNHHIHIALALTKSHDRVEWFMEKVVELGVQEISFIETANSERKNVKMNRIERTAIAAMKQSLKAYLPKLNELVTVNDFIKSCADEEKYIGYLGGEKIAFLFHAAMPESSYCVLIGPEGDFNEKEITLAKEFGFQSISLGDCRLRTETAGVAACHLLNIINHKS